ncbi:MAG: hypothetical protein WAW36_13470 [Methylovulum miyakonense]|uniref:hypothetical protein n=1 Tax=Methylovulum miyakonense TaxID=645578 RepID=UPI003BB4F930
MNFIFGLIVLALTIIAVRVIWATLWQTLTVLKSAIRRIQLKMAQRNLKSISPVTMPCLPAQADWDIMAESVRYEIQRRNTGLDREANWLDAQLQAKLKTLELIKADIQIAKLEQELQKVRPVVVVPEAKKRKRTKSSESAVVEQNLSAVPHQVHQLRAALKGGAVKVDNASGIVRH